MAIVKNTSTDEIIVLHSQHLFGRNQQLSNTHISESDISQSHATIFWKCDCWYLKDHSRNGTLVNGKFISQSTHKLQNKDTIQFGQATSTKWQLIENNAPSSYLQSLTHKHKIYALPFSLDMLHTLYQDVHIYRSVDQQWNAKIKNNTIVLIHGTTIAFNNDTWIFIENKNFEETIDHGQILKQAYYQFTLSQDEEHIDLKIISNKLMLDLGSRIYNYLLLTLARKRLLDANASYSIIDQGWIAIEDLISDLSKEFVKDIDAYYINLQIYRIRKNLSAIEPYGYLFINIIERKNGFIRFAHPYFKIIKETQVIGELPVKL